MRLLIIIGIIWLAIGMLQLGSGSRQWRAAVSLAAAGVFFVAAYRARRVRAK